MRRPDIGDALYSVTVGSGLASFVHHVITPLDTWASLLAMILGASIVYLARWESATRHDPNKPRTF